MKKENIKYIVIAVIFIIFTFLLDYFNVYSYILPNVSNNINMSLFEVIINNVVLVTTFIITYFSIDKKNIEKDEKIKENKEYVLKQYLKDTYNKCLEIISFN